MFFELILLVCTIPINLFLLFLVLQKNGKDKTSLYFAASVIFLCLWAVGDALLLFGKSPALAGAGFYLFYIAPLFAALCTYLFVISYEQGDKGYSKFRNPIIAFVALCAAVIASDKGLLLADFDIVPNAANHIAVQESGWFVYELCFTFLFGLSYYYLYRTIRTTGGRKRVQAQYVAFGIFLTSFLPSITNLLLPSQGVTDYIWLGPIFTLAYVSTSVYAIIKHQLFDIRTFVVRATVYATSNILLSVLYIAPLLYFIGTVILGFPFVAPKFIIGVILATVAAYNFERLRSWFDAKTNRIFFQDSYDSAVLLGELNRILVSTIDLKALLRDSANLVMSNLKADYCAFILYETAGGAPRALGAGTRKFSNADLHRLKLDVVQLTDDVIIAEYLPAEQSHFKKILADNDAAILIRLSNKLEKNQDDLGCILLGYKKSGRQYTAQDVHTLGSIADVSVIAIQNALHYEEIQNFTVTLQRKVDEATRQLRRTNAKLEALDETKDDFISMASHQLRTPLTSVKGYLSMVLEGDAGKLTTMQRKMLDQSFVSSQRMVFLIADLLNISRLKTGKFVIEPTKLNLAALVGDEVAQLKETAKSRQLTLNYDKPAAFPELMLDETKIRQVIMNFIDNAIFYTTPGGTIRVELVDKPASVEFRVIDNGIGVPKSEQPHLFTKFYRAGNARRARPDGTGLGLYMAKKVVVAQGGAIIFESKEGKGSAFGFVFSKSKLLPIATIDAARVKA